MNFTANGLLAFRGSPIMAKVLLQMNDIAGNVDGVLINIGTLTEKDLQAMLLARKIVNEHNIPVVLELVGYSASDFSIIAIKPLLNEVKFTDIKGNAGEMAFLVNTPWQTKGVESIDDAQSDITEIAKAVANEFNSIAVVTGEIDIVSNGIKTAQNTSGHIYLTKITGAGCVLGSLITSSLAVSKNHFQAILDTLNFFGKAAEHAVNHHSINGTGTFIPHFIDALSLDSSEVDNQ